MSSCIVVKEEVTSEMEEEDEEELKRRKRRERRKLYVREMRERIRRVCAGEDVPGVGEEERKRILDKEEQQRERNLLKIRERREFVRRICAGEDVPGVTEEQRWKIIEKEEMRKQKDKERKIKLSENDETRKERLALCAREKSERIRRICAGEDVPGVGEEERIKIIEKEEKRKEMKRLYMRKRHVEKQEKRRAYIKEYNRRKKMEETEEEREARVAKQKFNSLVRRVQRTEEEKEEIRRQHYFNMQARMAMMSEEERQEWKRRRNERHKERLKNLSEEKRRKHEEALKRASKKWQQKMKEKDPEGFKRKMKKYQIYQKKLWERMSEEEKRRRLNQMKMYQQKRKLRKKLGGTLDDEEIERRLDELDKRLREELGIGPPRVRVVFGRRDSDFGDVSVGATCSPTGPVDKQEVGQMSNYSFLNLNPTTLDADSQVDQVEQAESNFCDFNDDEGASMPPSPHEETQLHSPSPQVTDNELTFSCEYCECFPFLNENDLKSHLQNNHLKICWKCPSCKEVMISAKHLSEHFKAVHKKQKPSSPVDTQTQTIEREQVKEPAVEVSSVPQNGRQEKSNSRKSGVSFSRKDEYLCLKCPLKKLVNSSRIITMFKDWRGLHSHVKNKHRKYYWPCEYCHLLKYSKRSLIVHLMLCTKKPET